MSVATASGEQVVARSREDLAEDEGVGEHDVVVPDRQMSACDRGALDERLGQRSVIVPDGPGD
eukprot:6267617-Heterocapsa_arctica.AAC.2